MEKLQEQMHIVLVEPADNLNIGAAARAMMNFGFKHLHLVKPQGFSIAGAKITARAAVKLLEKARLHTCFEDAVKDVHQVIAFSCYQGEYYFGQKVLDEWLETLSGATSQRIALVFGPEDSGLRAEHFAHCRWIVRIPTSAECSALNLAQSVLLVLHQLSRLAWGSKAAIKKRLAAESHYQQLDSLLENILLKLNLVQAGRKSPLPGRLKNLLRRTAADDREIKSLLALFGRIVRRLPG